MNQIIDEKIRVTLMDNDIHIPDECLKQMEDTISGLTNNDKHEKQKRFRTAVAIVICLFLIPITAFGAVDLMKQRMKDLTKEEKDEYYQGLQSSTANADSFTRELTKSENDKMEELKVKYKNGLFPAKALTIVKTRAAADKSAELYFAEDKSLFVLPSRELTEEEMLEIIDFYYCRDYSLMENPKQENITGVKGDTNEENITKAEKDITKDKINVKKNKMNNDINKDKAIELAKTAIKDIYGVECAGLDITVEYDNKIDALTVSMEDTDKMSGYSVTVDASHESIEEIYFAQHDDYSVFGIAADRKKYIDKYKDALDIITSRMKIDKSVIKSTCEYNYNKDGSLERGVVSYFFKMKDGTGYLIKYSCAYDVFFDILKTDFDKYRQTMDQSRKKRGLEREIIQMK